MKQNFSTSISAWYQSEVKMCIYLYLFHDWFHYGLFTNSPDIIVACDFFFRVHWNSKVVSYLPWQNKYPNLKTTCHIKPKLFLWTRLSNNLLLAKYLVSVAATLRYFLFFVQEPFHSHISHRGVNTFFITVLRKKRQWSWFFADI